MTSCPTHPEDADGDRDDDGCPDAPVTTAEAVPSQPGKEGWTSGRWTVTLACDSCAFTEYSVGDGGSQRYAKPFTLEREGTHVVRFRSRDAGGTLEDEQKIALGIDRSNPKFSMTTRDGSVFIGAVSPVVLGAHAMDAPAPDGTAGSGVVDVCLTIKPVGGLAPGSCVAADEGKTGWTAHPKLLPGIYEVSARATDRAGNEGVSDVVRIVVA